jgi:hypothetical protein
MSKSDDEAAAVRAIRAGCESVHVHCGYPQCSCDFHPRRIRAAIASYVAGPLPRSVLRRAFVEICKMDISQLAKLAREEDGDGG